MKRVFYLLLSSILVQVAVGQDCLLKEGMQCSTDCKNVVFCPAIDAEPIVIVPCKNETFCEADDTNLKYTCTASYCINPDHPFLCTGNGFYPSAYKCNVAYFCARAAEKPILECVCKPEEYYDLATGTCKDNSDKDCSRTVNCSEIGIQLELVEGFCYICDSNREAVVIRCGGNNIKDLLYERAEICGPYTGL